MTAEQKAARAAAFAGRVKNLARFLTADPATSEMYGCKTFALDERKLRPYYEHHEPLREWRDFDTFRACVSERADFLTAYGL